MSRRRTLDRGMAMRDLLFNLSLAFSVIMIIALLMIGNEKREDVVRPAEYLITMTWNDESPNDVDLHLLYDGEDWVNYKVEDREKKHIFLERDDRGYTNDFYENESGEKVPLKLNREVITLRTKTDGHYALSAHMYQVFDNYGGDSFLPENVVIEVLQLNPYRIIAVVEKTLATRRMEMPMLTFDIEGGEVVNVDLNSDEKIIYRGLPAGTIPLSINDMGMSAPPYNGIGSR